MIDRTSAKSTLILGCLFAQLRVPAGAPTTGRLLADLHDLGNVGDAFQRLDVRVDQYALDSRHVMVEHSPDAVASASADANHLYSSRSSIPPTGLVGLIKRVLRYRRLDL